eukprot:Gb_38324 [translate_table: standard]
MKTIFIWLLAFSILIRVAAAQGNVNDQADISADRHGHEEQYIENNNSQILGRQTYENWLEMIRNTSASGSTVKSSSIQQDGLYASDQLPAEITVLSVAKNGLADFQSVQDAVDFVPENNTQRVIIFIGAGVYREKVTIPKSKSCITLQGEGKRSTIIRWHDKAYDVDGFGNNMGTLLSASVAVNSDDFAAANISFQNTARFPHSTRYRQAVALRISGDRAIFVNCGFYGHQDTLYDHAGSHYFNNCSIRGSVDFIFGNGRSLYEGCHLHALGRVGALTAQNREEPNEPTGFAFLRCRVTGSGRPYLGRAWGDFSRVVYVRSVLESALNPEAWSDFGHPHRKRTAFYGMYECTGHGVITAMESGWTKELTYEEARPFLDRSFINASTWVQPSLVQPNFDGITVFPASRFLP